jgi:hypothetical protein
MAPKFYHVGICVFLAVASLTGCGTSHTPGPVGAVGPVGPPGLIFMDAYSATTAYVTTDVVTYRGSSYTALLPNTNVLPIGATQSAVDWAVLAQAGAIGATGLQGSVGIQGPVGPQGVQGATGSQGPSGLVGLPGPVGPSGPVGPTGPQGPASPQVPSYLNGRRFGVQGDSISSTLQIPWQSVVVKRTGMTLVSQDARPGRKLETAFECYGNPAVGGQLGVFNAAYIAPSVGWVCGDEAIGAKPGNTLAQNLTDVDIEVIDLGTNVSGQPIGELGDAVTAGTFYGNLRWVVETYLAAKPSMRVVLVTVQYGKAVQLVNAVVAYGASMGLPVVNMYALGGANAFTLFTLTLDGTHPNPYGIENFYGPVIAQALQQVF